MSKAKRKPSRLKRFKGYIRIPLDTSTSLDHLMAQAVRREDWANPYTYRQIVNPKNRYIWYINLYLFNILGEKTIEKVRCTSKMNAQEMRGVLDHALKIAENHILLDYSKSYITVSV